MMVKCLIGCMFWRNAHVEYNCFNVTTVDQHGWDESVIFYGTIMRKHSSSSDFCGSQHFEVSLIMFNFLDIFQTVN